MDNDLDFYYKTNSPLSFLAWLESKQTISQDYNKNLIDYQDYVSEWHRFNKSTEDVKQNSFAGLYVNLLREISLTYSTEEEKRFISNCDFTKPEELDIVLPFFIQKLKTIIIYYYNKREGLKKKVKNLTYRGTTKSASDLVKDIILEEVQSEALQVVAGTDFTLPKLENIAENLRVTIDEKYDDTVYFNKKSDADELNVTPDFYINFKQSILTAIRKYPVFLKGIQANFSLNLNLSGTEFNLLKKRDFADYFFSNSQDNLKLLLYSDLAVKFMGCDMYYLSTGTTNTEYVTGRLFSTLPLSGNVVLNPLNNRYPTFASTPSLEDIYTSYECGEFFIPSKVAALKYNTFDKTYTLDRSKLKPDSVIVFPDPKIAGNVIDAEGHFIEDYPLMYEIEVSWNKEQRQNAFKFGDVISKPLFHKFYPYESYATTAYKDDTGISSPYDNLNFWSGEKDTVWTNSDVWPDLKTLEKLPIDERLKSLLIDQDEMVKWFVDIFGNEYGLFKKKTDSIIDRRRSKGKLYIKTTDNKINTLDQVYNSVFAKLPAHIAQETVEPINVYVINNTILLETENYVIIDIINYDPQKLEFISSFYPGFFRKKYQINSELEKFIGFTYRNDNNALYLCFTTLNSHLSASNYKTITPLIFKVDLSTRKVFTVYSNSDFTTTYSLSSVYLDSPELDIRYIESGHFSFKEKFGLYNLTYIAYNLNNIPFVVNEKFYTTPYAETFLTTNPILFKPFLYIYDTNFTNHVVKSETGFVSPYTDWAGSENIEHFKFHRESLERFKYSNLNSFSINTTGALDINFDWSKTDTYNLYIGCSAFPILNANNFLLFQRNNKILNQVEREYLLFDFIKDNYVISTFGKIQQDSNLSKMKVTVRETFFRDVTATNVPAFTGALCDEFANTVTYDIDKFDNYMAVSLIDPVFLNKPGTYFLYFDWEEYNQISIFIGCQPYNISYVEDVLLFSSPLSLLLDEEVWYDLARFTNENREFFVKAKILKNCGRGIVEFYIGEILEVGNSGVVAPPFSGIFCDSIYSIFKTVNIEKVGDGTGIVKSYPACALCGEYCTFQYPVSSTILLNASAGFESSFSGWLGSDCDGVAGDCALFVTQNSTVSAIFTRLSRYDLTIFVNVTGANVTSGDSTVNCSGIGTCTYSFLGGTPISLEATPAQPGFVFRGFIGGTCDAGSRVCSFFINSNTSLTALYEPEFADILVNNVFQKNEFDTNRSFYIVGRDSEADDGEVFISAVVPGFQDNPQRGALICGNEGEVSPGSIICSLCQQIPIEHFHVFETRTNTLISLSAPVYQDKFLFFGYLGERCVSEISDYCPILVSRYVDVSGVFTPPIYPLVISHYSLNGNPFHLGNILVYDRFYTNRSNINCNSYGTTDDCLGLYLSGTKITISAIPEGGSVVDVLSSNDITPSLYLSGVGIQAITGINFDFYITKNTVISAYSSVREYSTITIYKSSYPDNLLNRVIITPGPAATPNYIIEGSDGVTTLQYPKNIKLQIYPQNSTIGRSTYAIGFSGLKYHYQTLEGSGLTIDPNPSLFDQGPTLLGVGIGISMVGSTGPFTSPGNLFKIDFSNFELTLTENAHVSCVFEPYIF